MIDKQFYVDGHYMNEYEYNKLKGIKKSTPVIEISTLSKVATVTKTDPVVNAVCADLQSRSHVGIVKYGTTLADNNCTLRDKLQHAYEECLDQANYLKWAILQIDLESDDGK